MSGRSIRETASNNDAITVGTAFSSVGSSCRTSHDRALTKSDHKLTNNATSHGMASSSGANSAGMASSNHAIRDGTNHAKASITSGHRSIIVVNNHAMASNNRANRADRAFNNRPNKDDKTHHTRSTSYDHGGTKDQTPSRRSATARPTPCPKDRPIDRKPYPRSLRSRRCRGGLFTVPSRCTSIVRIGLVSGHSRYSVVCVVFCTGFCGSYVIRLNRHRNYTVSCSCCA